MGKEKYQREIELLLKKSPVVSFSSLERIIRKQKKVKQYQKQLIRNSILKGKLKALAKGYYTAYDNPSLSVFCFKPGYLGLQDALSFHNLWEQETIPIIITSRKVRSGIRKIMGMNVLLRRIDKKYMFGVDYFQDGNFCFPYSDIEKTFIDMVYFKEELSREALKNLSRKLNKKKLNNYLKHYPESIKKQILTLIHFKVTTNQKAFKP